MAWKKTKDAVARIGEYKTSDGEIKYRNKNIGAKFENEDGHEAMKFDVAPVGTYWDGWVSFYEPREFNKDSPKTNPTPDSGPPPLTRDAAKDDDVPF